MREHVPCAQNHSQTRIRYTERYKSEVHMNSNLKDNPVFSILIITIRICVKYKIFDVYHLKVTLSLNN